jgi:hypothetical protein
MNLQSQPGKWFSCYDYKTILNTQSLIESITTDLLTSNRYCTHENYSDGISITFQVWSYPIEENKEEYDLISSWLADQVERDAAALKQYQNNILTLAEETLTVESENKNVMRWIGNVSSDRFSKRAVNLLPVAGTYTSNFEIDSDDDIHLEMLCFT